MMVGLPTVLATLIALTLASSRAAAAADCDIGQFGKHSPPPAPLRSSVEDQYAQFEWGSDAFSDGSYWWSIDYIKNGNGSRPLAISWEKGGIKISTMRPLLQGAVVSRCTVLGEVRSTEPELDRDAPIIYGLNAQTQQAAIFVAEDRRTPDVYAPRSAPLSLESLSISQKGEGHLSRITVEVASGQGTAGGTAGGTTGGMAASGSLAQNPSAKYFILYISASPPGIKLAFSNLPTDLSGAELNELTASFRRQGLKAVAVPLSKLASSETIKQLAFPPEVLEKPFLVLLGGGKAIAYYSTPLNVVAAHKQSYLVVLDDKGAAVMSGKITLTVPTPQ